MTAKEVITRRPQDGDVVRAVVTGPPPLESGDRLTRYEFEQRYMAMPHTKKAELLEGVVYMPTPVRFEDHAEPHALVITWLGVYCAATPGVRLGDNATVRLDMDNEVQPDALLRLDTTVGGHSQIGVDGYVEGAPELIVEIAASSASYDMHDKLEVYRRNAVQEYIIWQVYDARVEWFALKEDQYVLLTPDAHSVIESRIFSGLRLSTAALLNGDTTGVLTELQKGLEMDEHKVLIERLKAARDAIRVR